MLLAQRFWWSLEDAIEGFFEWLGEKVPHKVFRPRPESRIIRPLIWLHSQDWERKGTFCAAGWQTVGKVASDTLGPVVSSRLGTAAFMAVCAAAAVLGSLFVALVTWSIVETGGIGLALAAMMAAALMGFALIFCWKILSAAARYICPLRYELPELPQK